MPRKKANPPAENPEDKTPTPAPEAAAPGEPSESATVETSPQGCPAVVRAPKGLNLRAGPALSYEVLAVLPDGTEVTALDLPMGTEVPGWRLVAASGRTGWLQSRFLRLVEG